MADVTVSVTGQQAIVNPTTWNASNVNWGAGSWNTGGDLDQIFYRVGVIQHGVKLIGVMPITTIQVGVEISGDHKFGVVLLMLLLHQQVLVQLQT